MLNFKSKNNLKKYKHNKRNVEELLLYYEDEFSFLKENLNKILNSNFDFKTDNVEEFKIEKQKFIDSTVDNYFKKIRTFFIDILKLKKGFTYEEVYKSISRKHIDVSLKEEFKKLILELNELEYSPNKNYEKLYDVLDELLFLSKKVLFFEKQKENDKIVLNVFIVKLKVFFSFLKKITFIFWFPFYFLFLKLSSVFRREYNPVFEIKKFVDMGEKLLEKKNLYEAVKIYNDIKKKYVVLDDDDKLLLKPKILSFYNHILDLYEDLEKVDSNI